MFSRRLFHFINPLGRLLKKTHNDHFRIKDVLQEIYIKKELHFKINILQRLCLTIQSFRLQSIIPPVSKQSVQSVPQWCRWPCLVDLPGRLLCDLHPGGGKSHVKETILRVFRALFDPYKIRLERACRRDGGNKHGIETERRTFLRYISSSAPPPPPTPTIK